MASPETDQAEVARAIQRVEQAGAVVRDLLNSMRGEDGAGYVVLPSAEDLVDDLHQLINHLMVARSALDRVYPR